MELEVRYTKDLSIFRFFVGNRKENKNRTNRIMFSIMKKDCLKDFPIIVDLQHRILDGQNRVFAVRNLQKKGIDIGIYYKYSICLEEADIPLVNCAVTTWNIKDYLDMYVSQGNIHYIMFDNFCKRFGITKLTSAMALFCGFNNRKSDNMAGNNAFGSIELFGTSRKGFTNGDFIYPENDSEIVLRAEMLSDLAVCTKSNDAFEPSLVIACNEIFKHPDYSHEKMKKNISLGVFPKNGYRNAVELTEKLENIYNYRNKTPIRFTRPH